MASQTMERDLYNGKYHVVHNPNARGRSPRYLVNGEMKPKGVTTIIGQTLSKDLIPWAVGACCDYLRTKLPVVTEEDLVIGAVEYERLRDAGGSTGSEAHAMVEEFLKQEKTDGDNAPSQGASNAFRAFKGWFDTTKPEILGVEDTIFSEQYGYCGTYDFTARIDGKIYLCDLKTTNPSKKAPAGIYAENFIQMGAYALAHNEQRLYEGTHGGTKLPEIDGLMLISAKKNGVLDVVTAEAMGLSVSDCAEMFKRTVNIFNFMGYVTDKLGGK